MKKILDYKHKLHYPVLIVMLSMGLFLSMSLSYDRQLQMVVVVMTACFYAAWGIFHHAAHHSLSSKIVIEYILMAAVGMSVILFLLRI